MPDAAPPVTNFDCVFLSLEYRTSTGKFLGNPTMRSKLPILSQADISAVMDWLAKNLPCRSIQFNGYLTQRFGWPEWRITAFRRQIRGIVLVKSPAKNGGWWLVGEEMLHNAAELRNRMINAETKQG